MDIAFASSLPLVLASAAYPPPNALPNNSTLAAKIARIFRASMSAKVDQAQVHLHGRGLTVVWNLSDMANHRQSATYSGF
jgi:hypothetical protein